MGYLILLAILVVASIYFIMLYNGLVNLKHNVAKAWANIDARLLRKPKDGRLFLLSNLPEQRLARKYVLRGGFHLLVFWVPSVAWRICWVSE